MFATTCSTAPDPFLKLEQRAQSFAAAADYEMLRAGLSNLMKTLVEVPPPIKEHKARTLTIGVWCCRSMSLL